MVAAGVGVGSTETTDRTGKTRSTAAGLKAPSVLDDGGPAKAWALIFTNGSPFVSNFGFAGLEATDAVALRRLAPSRPDNVVWGAGWVSLALFGVRSATG